MLPYCLFVVLSKAISLGSLIEFLRPDNKTSFMSCAKPAVLVFCPDILSNTRLNAWYWSPVKLLLFDEALLRMSSTKPLMTADSFAGKVVIASSRKAAKSL